MEPKTHPVQIGYVIRDLPVERPPGLPFRVAVFDMLGDVEIAMAAAAELKKRIPPGVQALIMPYGKATGLLHELGRLTGLPTIVARKELRFYMKEVVSVGGVKSVTTTERLQEYHLNGIDVERLRGKKVAFVDDVVSTRGSLRSMQELLRKIDVELMAIMAVFTEGDTPHADVISLGHLPLFHDE